MIATRRAIEAAVGVVAMAVVAMAMAAAPAHANSVFAVGGLGEPSLEENARLRALGGAGAAEHGPNDFSLVNPASIAEARHLQLEATLLATRRSVSTESYGDESAHETSFPSVRFSVRLPSGLVIGGSYLLGTNAGFEVERPESSGAASLLRIDGRGGVDFIRATMAKRIFSRIHAGIDYEVIGGSYREEWSRRFSGSSLAPSKDTLEVSWDRLGRWRFGAQYVRSRFTVGAAYETGRRVPVTERHRTAGSNITVSGNSLQIPEGFAAGFQVSLTERFRAVGQYRRQSYVVDAVESDLVDFRWLERYSIGFERGANPLGGKLGRLPLRIGGTLLRWPDLLPPAGAVDVVGGVGVGVDEWAASIGTGVRTRDGGGAIDLSLEGGRRGDQTELGASETFFRLAISVRVSDETWK